MTRPDPDGRRDTDPAAEPAQRVARVWIPAVLLLAAVVATVAGVPELGGAFLGAAVVAVIADLWIRLGIRSQDDRDDEARARRFFARRGRWPGE
jgi:hypothetical protein